MRQRHAELSGALGAPPAKEDGNQPNPQSTLHTNLSLLIQVANGEYIRGSASAATVQRVAAALAHVLDMLFGNALHTRPIIPDNFWRSDIGVLVSRARWWLSADDLITISNAAALAFGANNQANRMRIVRAIDNGLLDWIPDPSVANPQQNRRVLRTQVERLRDYRRLPE